VNSYVDTSALAKWYLNESYSDEFVAWIERHAPVAITTLTSLEMRSLLARRRRDAELDAKLEAKLFAAFEQDIADGHVSLHRLEDRQVLAAQRLFARVPDLPLRSLDALHLASAIEIGVERLATADRVMADAAVALGLEGVRFY
jgi:predicted nucleic acid-binding protein